MSNRRPLRIAILRSDGPHHDFLERVLTTRFAVTLSVIEPDLEQRRRLFRRGRFIDWFWRWYHDWRRSVLGLNRYRRSQFVAGPASSQPTPALIVTSINNKVVVSALADARPDVTVVMGTSVLKTEVLDAAGGCVINIHGGHLPEYRGNWCFFFAVYDGRPDLAASTIHFVDAGIDTGDLIEHVSANAKRGETAEQLYCRAEKGAVIRLAKLLADMESGQPLPRRPQPAGGRTFRIRDRKPHHDFVAWVRRVVLRTW